MSRFNRFPNPAYRAFVIALGGWSSYDAIESYLATLTEENIIKSMSTVTL